MTNRPARLLPHASAWRLAAPALALLVAGCLGAPGAPGPGTGPGTGPGPGTERGPGPATTRSAAAVPTHIALLASTDSALVPAPALFAADATALWDGGPTLGGVWVALPGIDQARRVRLTNAETGAAVDGALIRGNPDEAGPEMIISAAAARALGLKPDQATAVHLVALVRAAEAGAGAVGGLGGDEAAVAAAGKTAWQPAEGAAAQAAAPEAEAVVQEVVAGQPAAAPVAAEAPAARPASAEGEAAEGEAAEGEAAEGEAAADAELPATAAEADGTARVEPAVDEAAAALPPEPVRPVPRPGPAVPVTPPPAVVPETVPAAAATATQESALAPREAPPQWVDPGVER